MSHTRIFCCLEEIAKIVVVFCCSGFNITGILHECKRWEQMPNRREPVTNEMMAHIVADAAKDTNPDSLLNTIADYLVMGKYGGFRKSEWLQDYADARKGRYARNLDGSAKAFIIADFSFQRNKRIIDAR